MSEITLENYQIGHYEKVKNVLTKSPCYVDTSETGAGKTIIATKLAKDLNLSLFVVCPTSVIPDWKKTADLYGAKYETVISYSSLAHRKAKHGLLYRRLDNTFTWNEKFEDMVKSGILLIFDECQFAKNDSGRSFACRELARCIANVNSESKIGILSHTPTDKNNIVPLIQLMGIVKNRIMFDYNNHTQMWSYKGLVELGTFANTLEYNIYVYFNMGRRESVDFCFNVYESVLSKYITSSMKKKDRIDLKNRNIKMKIVNLSCSVNKNDSKNIQEALGAIKTAILENRTTTNLSLFMRLVECIKIPIFCRLIENFLAYETNTKIIVFLNYTVSINLLAYFFKKYNPLILNGTVSKGRRITSIDSFQEENLKHRLLICNTSVGGVGLNLDDTNGNFPRRLLVSPSFNGINMYQAIGRGDRAKTKSIPMSFFIFAGDEDEVRLLETIKKKSDRIRSLSEHSVSLTGELVKETDPTALFSRDMYMFKIRKLIDMYGTDIPIN